MFTAREPCMEICFAFRTDRLLDALFIAYIGSSRDAADRGRARCRAARLIRDGVVMPLKENRMSEVSGSGRSKVPEVTLRLLDHQDRGDDLG